MLDSSRIIAHAFSGGMAIDQLRLDVLLNQIVVVNVAETGAAADPHIQQIYTAFLCIVEKGKR